MNYKTRKPQLSDTTINLVRSAAHRYVTAGGSIFPTQNDTEAEQHIGNVVAALSKDSDEFDQLLDALDLSFETRERLWSAAWATVSKHSDGAFLFGAFVGLELAGLTSTPLRPTRHIAKKGGAR